MQAKLAVLIAAHGVEVAVGHDEAGMSIAACNLGHNLLVGTEFGRVDDLVGVGVT